MTNSIFDKAWSAYQALNAELDAMLPGLVEARRKYFATRTAEDEQAMQSLHAAAGNVLGRLENLRLEMQTAVGVTEEQLATLKETGRSGDRIEKTSRNSLTADRVPPTADIDMLLPNALQRLEALIPPDFMAQQSEVPHGLEALIAGTEILSLVRGVRPQSETTPLHRLRQMMRVTRDFLDKRPTYDHFAGAMLVPQTVQLGSQLPNIEQVGGGWLERVARLWTESSAQADSTTFELLVAGALSAKGRKVEFITEDKSAPSPDIRCWDPYPMQVECKRKRPLSDYELREEARMREVFLELRRKALAAGVWGRFSLRLSQDFTSLDPEEISAALLRQRLAAQPRKELEYAWGKVAFTALPLRVRIPEETKLYSPYMLQLFGWRTDLQEWDGLLCELDGSGEAVVDRVERPLGLVWTNESEQAMRRRAWVPLDLLGDAMRQFTPGEHGMVYLAYQEGAREEVADKRVQDLLERLPQWSHDANIRVPMILVLRLYPRMLDHGLPDLIESNMRMSSSTYGTPETFDFFPQRIFTPENDNWVD